MNNTHLQQHIPRRSAGQVSLTWIALLALLALSICAVVYLSANRNNNTAGPSTTQEEIAQRLADLQTALQTALQEDQDLARLAALARAFTEDHPENQAGHVLLAQIRMRQDHWQQAYDAWQRALAIDDRAFEICKMAGVCAAKLGRIDQALTHYEQAVAATNDQADAEVYAALGQLHLALNNTDLAEQMFKRAIDAPGPGEKTNYKHKAYAGLADVASLREQHDEALKWADRAIKMAGLDSEADAPGYHIQKARLYMTANRDQDALTWLSYTWSEFPETPWRIESARLRARLYERAGQLDAAVDYIQTVTEYHQMAQTRNVEIQANFIALLADWQIKAKRRDAAKISLHNLQTVAPDHPAIESLKERLR